LGHYRASEITPPIVINESFATFQSHYPAKHPKAHAFRVLGRLWQHPDPVVAGSGCCGGLGEGYGQTQTLSLKESSRMILRQRVILLT
jgi:hypothetical protein